mgnify:CR=1 FL=1
MANKYSGTQTEKNLAAAFAGESQARNKYTYFASRAKKDGFEQIADIFQKTADNEKEHAKMWHRQHSREPCCCGRRRELRMDRHVRRLRQDSRRGGLQRIGT